MGNHRSTPSGGGTTSPVERRPANFSKLVSTSTALHLDVVVLVDHWAVRAVRDVIGAEVRAPRGSHLDFDRRAVLIRRGRAHRRNSRAAIDERFFGKLGVRIAGRR